MGKTLADLQSNISISAENAVSGTLKWVEGYTGFSSNPAEQSGNYLALRIDAGGLEDATIVATYNGREVTLDSDQIIIVRHAEGEDTITFTASKEGYMTGVMTLDLSNLILTPEPYKLLNEFASVGLTQSPAGDEYEPNGTLYTLTGSVQWSTTYNDNRISYAGNFNKNTSGGTSIEISYGTGSGKVVLLSDTAQTAGDIDAYDGWIIVDNAAITAGTWYITIYDSEDNVLLNQMVDASALTLAPAPYVSKLTGATYNNTTKSSGDLYNADGGANYVVTNTTALEIPNNWNINDLYSYTAVSGYPSLKWSFIPEWGTPYDSYVNYMAITINPFYSEQYQKTVTTLTLPSGGTDDNASLYALVYYTSSETSTSYKTYTNSWSNPHYVNYSAGDVVTLPATIIVGFTLLNDSITRWIRGGFVTINAPINGNSNEKAFIRCCFTKSTTDGNRNVLTTAQRGGQAVNNSAVLYNNVPITNYQTVSSTTTGNPITAITISGTLAKDGNNEYALYISSTSNSTYKPLQQLVSSDSNDVVTEITDDVTGSTRRNWKVQSSTPTISGPSNKLYLQIPGTTTYFGTRVTINNNTTLAT